MLTFHIRSSTVGLTELVKESLKAQKIIRQQLSARAIRIESPLITRRKLPQLGAGKGGTSALSRAKSKLSSPIHNAHSGVKLASVKSSLSMSEIAVITTPRGLLAAKGAALCSCTCRKQSNPSTVGILEIFLGIFLVRFLGNASSYSKCHCPNTLSYNLCRNYRFPSYIIDRYISISLMYAPCNGPKLTLRIPRIMDRSHSLWTYARNGDIPAVQALFRHRLASPFDLDPDGCSALMNMAWIDNVEMVKLLLDQRADPHLPDQAGRTASQMLWTSAYTSRFGEEGRTIVAALLGDDDILEVMSFSRLHRLVIGIEQLPAVDKKKSVLKPNISMQDEQCSMNINAEGQQSFRSETHTATSFCQPLDCQDLLSEFLSTCTAEAINMIDNRGRTPLLWAVMLDDLETVTKLLHFKAKTHILDIRGKGPLHYVRSAEVLEALLQADADVHIASYSCLNTALHEIAIRHDNVEVVDAMIQAGAKFGAKFDAKNRSGKTPLLFAIAYRHTQIARRLIELGANVNAMCSSTRRSAILEAVESNHHEIIPSLLERGADYTTTDIDGKNIAHQCARFASTKTMAVLAKYNLSNLHVISRDKHGRTPEFYLNERTELIGLERLEPGMQQAWEKLTKSLPQCPLPAPIRNIAHSSEDENPRPVPGAFPQE